MQKQLNPLSQPVVYTFGVDTNPAPITQSEYNAYEVKLTGKQVHEAFIAGVLDIDWSYQRGKIAATEKKPAVPIQSLPRNQRHIESISRDLATMVSGRSIALLPPIWLNARRIDGGPNRLRYNQSGTLDILKNQTLFTVDGWHRTLSIRRAYQSGTLAPDQRFTFYIFDAPVAFEARAFRILNATALPVEPNRVHWVSAPWSQDTNQMAYEFVHATPSLGRKAPNGEWLYNLELTKARPSVNAAELASFSQIVNGFAQAPRPEESLWPASEVDTTSASDRAQIVAYMSSYWSNLVELLPQLDFSTPAARKKQRQDTPLLINGLTIQLLVWLGHQMLVAYQSQTGSTKYKHKLAELNADKNKQIILFEKLNALADPNGIPFFSPINPIWSQYIGPSGHLTSNNYGTRRQIFRAIIKKLGVDVPNSISLVAPIVSSYEKKTTGTYSRRTSRRGGNA